VSLCYKFFHFQGHWRRWHCTSIQRPACLFTLTWEVGLLPSPVEFSSHHQFYRLSHSWLLGLCCHSCLLRLLIYLQFREVLPLPPLCHSGRPALFAMCLFCCSCLLFRFFPLGGGWSVQRAMLMWPRVVFGSTACCLAHLWSASSQAIWALLSGGSAGALLVSPFYVMWECYAWAGGVEESKFCLFSVVFPVMCIFSIFPWFYFRKHTFCFLPLTAILESPQSLFLNFHGDRDLGNTTC
jgi:hypothetical protein